MTKFESLLDSIERDDIFYIETNSDRQLAKSQRDGDDCAIFFNECAFETSAERFIALGHEKAHCDSGMFYNVNTPLMTVGYCERRAWYRTMLDQLPFDLLMEAFGACKTMDGVSLYDLADYLDMTPNFVKHTIENYIRAGKELL